MEMRQLGNTGINVAPLALGTNVFGWTIDEQQSFNILDGFVDAGLNLVDTADMYSRWQPGNSGGESEMIIGKWLKQSGKRQKIVLATKVGADMGDGKKGLSKAYIIKAAEDSLKRLQTDHIDLYQSHFDDMDTPVAEPLEAYMQLIKEGKVIAIGASNFTPARLREALQAGADLGMPSYESLQPQYNLYEREGYEKELEAVCLERHISVIPYFPLASGFLTGKYRSEKDLDKSPRGQGVKKYMNERGMRILAVLDEVVRSHSVTPAAIALAWLMARPSVTAPIASATSLPQLQQLVSATQVKLNKDDIEKLSRL